MLDFKSFPKESKLPDTLIARLDDLSTRTAEIRNERKRTNCLLALSNFYWMTSEWKRACSLTDFMIDNTSSGGVRVSRRRPSLHVGVAETLSTWEIQEHRRNLARARTLLEEEKAEQAMDELVECRGLLHASNAGEELTEFMSLTWLALAAKPSADESRNVVSRCECPRCSPHGEYPRLYADLLQGIFYDRFENALPKIIKDATMYISKSWYLFALGDIDESQEMLKSVVIPQLQVKEEQFKHWAGCWIKAYGLRALVAARRREEDQVREALSKTQKVVTESRDPVNAKFQLLICMEAMEMLSKPNEAMDAQARFLDKDEDLPVEVDQDAATTSKLRDAPAVTDEAESAVQFVSPKAFCRTMAAIAWSSFRHPFTTTLIDVSTGDVIEGG